MNSPSPSTCSLPLLILVSKYLSRGVRDGYADHQLINRTVCRLADIESDWRDNVVIRPAKRKAKAVTVAGKADSR